MLSLAGSHAGVTRAHVFEETSPDVIRMTYEWCAEGVESFLAKLQHMDKKLYAHNVIMNAPGVFQTSAVTDLPESDQLMLETMGVKTVAFVPLVRDRKPFGFIGFDDCRQNRQGSVDDVQLLHNAGSVVSGLIGRRNVNRAMQTSMNIVQAVTDNLDDLVYISDLDTYRLKFISKSLARAVRREPEEILGEPCWRVLHRNQDGPCSFCPLPKVREREQERKTGSYVWELHNKATGKWYMVKDSIVGWIDGFRAHLGTFIDITYRKQYEEQLRHFAAVDAMTDVYNRKWGFGKLGDLFLSRSASATPQTLCFIDVDGLKAVNDRLGHALGDEMIVNTVRVVYSAIRKEDFICRWGGDEFILFLNCDMEDAQRVLEKIQFAIEHFNITSGKPYRLSISTGLVDFHDEYESLDELIGEADKLMYENKVRRKKRRQEKTRFLSG